MVDEKKLIGKRSQLFRKLLKYRDIIPGSLSDRRIACGKATCICKREGKLHTAYQYYCKLSPEEKPFTKMIPKDLSQEVAKQVSDNKEFKKIIKQIYKINLELLLNRLEKRKR